MRELNFAFISEKLESEISLVPKTQIADLGLRILSKLLIYEYY